MKTLEECSAALGEAERRWSEIEKRRREALRKAEAEVNATFEAERRATRDAINAAQRELTAAKDAIPDHPWTGKRVFMMQMARGMGSWSRERVRVEGVVEMMRSSTVLPGNTADYRRPALGQPFVRMLKRDGTPALQFERSLAEWKLA